MTAIANDAGRHIGRPLSVFWVDDDAWYSGHIDDYQPNKGWHIHYDDGEYVRIIGFKNHYEKTYRELTIRDLIINSNHFYHEIERILNYMDSSRNNFLKNHEKI